MKLSRIIADVRRVTQDQEALRFDDRDIVEVLNLAITEVQRLRPDIVALHDADFVMTSDTEVPLPLGILVPVEAFVSGWLLLGAHRAPSEDETKAAALIQRLSASLLGAA
jgi:hypothetical protein